MQTKQKWTACQKSSSYKVTIFSENFFSSLNVPIFTFISMPNTKKTVYQRGQTQGQPEIQGQGPGGGGQEVEVGNNGMGE